MRTEAEIDKAERKLNELLYYHRDKYMAPPPSHEDEDFPDTTPWIEMIEAKYRPQDLAKMTDFEWGKLHGKLSALRWVEGRDWDMLQAWYDPDPDMWCK